MRAMALNVKHDLIGLGGVVERNLYLVKRYIWWDVAFFLWTVANTLTIVFIAKGIPAVGGKIDVERVTTILLVGAVIWAYLGIIFEILTETVAWERWEGTIEYTFMAPLARPVHLIGMGTFGVLYGLVRTAAATSTNVSGGMTMFTLLGFMGLYLLLGALYVLIFMRIVHEGPAASRPAQPAAPKPQAKAGA